MSELRSINVCVGDQIEYLGPTMKRWICQCVARTCSRPEHQQVLKSGDIGTVTRVTPIDPPNDLLVVDEDDKETYAGRDGHALVKWPNYQASLIWPESEGARWRRVTKRKAGRASASKGG